MSLSAEDNMNDLIRSLLLPIHGSTFLFLYAVYIVILFIIVYRFFGHSFNLSNKTNINKDNLSNISLAYLKGGTFSVIELCLFSMYKNGLINVSSKHIVTYISAKGDRNKTTNEAETFLFDYLDKEKPVSDFIYNKDFLSKFNKIINADISILRQNGYLRQGLSKSLPTFGFIIPMFLIIYPAVLKIQLGLARYKPVTYIMTLLVISVIAFFIMYSLISYKFKYTKKALNLLKSLQKSLNWYVADLKSNKVSNKLDPLFAAAVLGTGIFYSIGDYYEISSALYPLQHNVHSGNSGSDSSGCSSSSCSGSSCSSSSCGGSSCGGGGCGGCGGGD